MISKTAKLTPILLTLRLDEYFRAKDAVHEAFRYQPDWKEIPLDDARENHWLVIGEDNGDFRVVVESKEPLTLASVKAGKKIFSATCYRQRFLPRWIYRAAGHALLSVDTHTDGNKFLRVYDVAKEQSDPALAACYLEHWNIWGA